MRTSVARLGLGFGKLGVTVRGTTKYHISPIEQRAFAGAFAQGLPNTLWRIRSSFFIVVPPFIMSYLIFTETEKEHDRYILSWFHPLTNTSMNIISLQTPEKAAWTV